MIVRLARGSYGVFSPRRIGRSRHPDLPHDDYRRAHHNLWRADNDYRRPDDDIVMMLESCMLVPAAIGYQTAGGGEKSYHAA